MKIFLSVVAVLGCFFFILACLKVNSDKFNFEWTALFCWFLLYAYPVLAKL